MIWGISIPIFIGSLIVWYLVSSYSRKLSQLKFDLNIQSELVKSLEERVGTQVGLLNDKRDQIYAFESEVKLLKEQKMDLEKSVASMKIDMAQLREANVDKLDSAVKSLSATLDSIKMFNGVVESEDPPSIDGLDTIPLETHEME